jgi:hypothetical protein
MVNRSGSTKRRLNETQHRESKTHQMGMQISCGLPPEVSQEKHLRVGEKRVGADHSRFSSAERKHSGGGASDGRPCSHAVVDPTEVLGFWGGRVYQGQECHCDSTEFHGSSEELCRAELLGEGILRVNGGAGRSADPRVHPRARERRPETRSTEHVQVRDASVSWPDRFERFTNQASGSAGGT